MTPNTPTVITAVVAGAGLGALPSGEVLVWAILGGVFAVWDGQSQDVALTGKWMAAAVLKLLLSAAAGVAISAFLLSVAPHHPMVSWLQYAPQWTIAALVAAMLFRVSPLVANQAKKWFGDKVGEKDANP